MSEDTQDTATADDATTATIEAPTEEATSCCADSEPCCDQESASAKDRVFVDQLREFAQATADTMKMAPEDIKSFVQKLVDQGNIAHSDGLKVLSELSERFRRAANDPVGRARAAAEQLFKREDGSGAESPADAESETVETGDQIATKVRTSVQRVLHAMNIATRKDLDAFGTQLTELERKIDALLESR